MALALAFGSSGALITSAQEPGTADSAGSRPAFVKKFTIESFGYTLDANGPGFESRAPQTSGGNGANGLECPYCVLIPLLSRSRSTLQPFGAVGTYMILDGRIEFFIGYGGQEAWLPDGAFRPGRRATTYNDAWLTQVETGANLALDHRQRIWLGGAAKYLQNYGSGKAGREHWNSFGANATFQFGH